MGITTQSIKKNSRVPFLRLKIRTTNQKPNSRVAVESRVPVSSRGIRSTYAKKEILGIAKKPKTFVIIILYFPISLSLSRSLVKLYRNRYEHSKSELLTTLVLTTDRD